MIKPSEAETTLQKLVDQFVESRSAEGGCGLFKCDPCARNIARRIGKASERKFRRYGIVPVSFYIWLKELNFVGKGFRYPEGGSTLYELARVLLREGTRLDDILSYLDGPRRRHLHRACSPELNKAFGTSDHIWAAIFDRRQLKGVKPPR